MSQRLSIDGWRQWIPAAIALTSSILIVVLIARLPVAILSDAGHDDAWFWQRAAGIVAGQWMGAYDQMTLMKGTGYPLFLAFNHAIGLPLMVTQALFYAGACLLLGSAVYRMTRRPWLALLVVVVLQWHPADMAWTRVLRDSIGSAQVLLVLACLLHFLFAPNAGKRGWRWAALAGLALGWMWTTREDAIWVVPGLAILVLARGWQARSQRAERRRLAIGCALMAVALAAWLALLATINLATYGVFATVDTKAAGYSDAMSALQRVRAGDAVPFVPVPRVAREAVYAVSPAFARLRPVLEGANHWKDPGCTLHPRACGDYAGGWFMWALRDAVASTGAYRSAPAADALYREVADDIGTACGDGRLVCAGLVVPGLPPVAAAEWKTLPGRTGRGLDRLLWQHIGQGQKESHVGSANARAMWDFIGRPPVPDVPATLVSRASGWYRDGGAGWLQLDCAGQAASMAITREPSADLVAAFKDPSAASNRFSLVLPAIDGCAIQSTTGTGSVPLADVTPSMRDFALGSGNLHFDTADAGMPRAASAAMAPRAIKYWIGRLYGAVLPWLAMVGLGAFAWASIDAWRRRRIAPLYILATAAWTLVASRFALLVLVDLLSFPALEVHYMQPAYPLLPLAAIASIALLVRARTGPGAMAGIG